KLMQTKGQLMKSLNTAFSFAPPLILFLTICRIKKIETYTILELNTNCRQCCSVTRSLLVS
ncbi:hypothetical protein, partial [Blautia obeum]|uniref:hypothetical protein n=1 Tax=Blautia obeum TaxID=40520 RepID=UPI001A9A668B